jgi:RNA polymerase sigma factor (sigma-70 family)
VCLEQLLGYHERLIHVIVQRQCRWGVDYADLVQEGRIALWQAICHYDAQRGYAFSTYAYAAIEHRLWRVLARARRHRLVGQPALPASLVPAEAHDPAEQVAARFLAGATRAALSAACRGLPERLRQAVWAWGVDGHAAQTLKALGRRYGVTGERARQWRQDALVLLRLPAYSGRLRSVCGQDTRAAYRRMEALSRAWLGRRHACTGTRKPRTRRAPQGGRA